MTVHGLWHVQIEEWTARLAIDWIMDRVCGRTTLLGERYSSPLGSLENLPMQADTVQGLQCSLQIVVLANLPVRRVFLELFFQPTQVSPLGLFIDHGGVLRFVSPCFESYGEVPESRAGSKYLAPTSLPASQVLPRAVLGFPPLGTCVRVHCARFSCLIVVTAPCR